MNVYRPHKHRHHHPHRHPRHRHLSVIAFILLVIALEQHRPQMRLLLLFGYSMCIYMDIYIYTSVYIVNIIHSIIESGIQLSQVSMRKEAIPWRKVRIFQHLSREQVSHSAKDPESYKSLGLRVWGVQGPFSRECGSLWTEALHLQKELQLMTATLQQPPGLCVNLPGLQAERILSLMLSISRP